MKKFVMLMFVIALLALVGCTNTPAAPTVEAEAPAEATTPTWQLYENLEGEFTLQYPPHWQMVELPDENEGQLHQVAFRGDEGEVEINWGEGMGGACPNGYEYLTLDSGQILQTCHTQNDDGTEMWSLFGEKGKGGLGGFAFTNNSEASSRELIEQILSTIVFTQN